MEKTKLSQKRVLIIYTGGTIGMVSTDSGYAPQSGYLKGVLEGVGELRSREVPDWDLLEFEQLLDSSNISIRHWNRMARIVEENYDDYDGFVILHGTDTMAYTASALSFMLEGLRKPVILTGSQIPIGQIRSDAKDNLLTSVIIAGEGKCPEVALYFGGKLHRGNRSTKIASDELIAFSSPNYPNLANVGINIVYHEHLFRPGGDRLKVTELLEELPIAVLKVFPGIQFGLFEGIMTQELKGLVLEAFGVGNLPEDNNGLIPAVEKAAANGTVITVCTQCLRGSVHLGAYETSSALHSHGAVCGFDMTVEAAVTKLCYLFSCGYESDDVRRLMEENLRGELTKS